MLKIMDMSIFYEFEKKAFGINKCYINFIHGHPRVYSAYS